MGIGRMQAIGRSQGFGGLECRAIGVFFLFGLRDFLGFLYFPFWVAGFVRWQRPAWGPALGIGG